MIADSFAGDPDPATETDLSGIWQTLSMVTAFSTDDRPVYATCASHPLFQLLVESEVPEQMGSVAGHARVTGKAFLTRLGDEW
jgi:hypothetical protein